MKQNRNAAVGLLAAVALVVSALSVLTAARATGQEPQEAKLMYACYMQGSGVVYRINPPDDPGQDPKLKDDCTGKNHVKFYWVEFVGADGKVGIGVPEPTAELDVAGDIHASGQLRLGENTITIDPVGNKITTGTDEDLSILPGGTGRVGIGTDTPAEMLTVAGTIESTDGGFKFPDGTVQATAASGGGTADHGSLTGLEDDDHLQYLLADGVRGTVDGFAVTGDLNNGAIPVEGQGVRMMWYPAKAAFRAGSAYADEWDDENIGNWSTGMGNSALASGGSSTAMGQHTVASGPHSTAIGAFATASGGESVALGNGATAEGHASVAMGSGTTASGLASTAMGRETTAQGSYSTAMGRETWAQSYAAAVLGQYNVQGGDQYNWVATDPVLVVGNGTSESSRSNAFTLLKNGNLTIADGFTANGIIESTVGGIKFPDGSVQTTSATALSVTRRTNDFTAYAGSMAGNSATCEVDEVATGGGLTMEDDPQLNVWGNYPNSSNGWSVNISNYGSSDRSVTVYVICLKRQ